MQKIIIGQYVYYIKPEIVEEFNKCDDPNEKYNRILLSHYVVNSRSNKVIKCAGNLEDIFDVALCPSGEAV